MKEAITQMTADLKNTKADADKKENENIKLQETLGNLFENHGREKAEMQQQINKQKMQMEVVQSQNDQNSETTNEEIKRLEKRGRKVEELTQIKGKLE